MYTLSGLAALGHMDCLLLCRTLRGTADRFYLDILERQGIVALSLEEALTAHALPPDNVTALRRRLRLLPPYAQEVLNFATVFTALRPSIIHIWQDMPLAALAARMGSPHQTEICVR